MANVQKADGQPGRNRQQLLLWLMSPECGWLPCFFLQSSGWCVWPSGGCRLLGRLGSQVLGRLGSRLLGCLTCWVLGRLRSQVPGHLGSRVPGCLGSRLPRILGAGFGGVWVPAAGVSGVPGAGRLGSRLLGHLGSRLLAFWVLAAGASGCLLLGWLGCRLPPASHWALGTHCIRAFPSPTVHLWGTEEVAAWLEHLSLCEYKDIFTRHDIRGSELLHLERRDLKVLPQRLLGTRPGLPCTPFSVPPSDLAMLRCRRTLLMHGSG